MPFPEVPKNSVQSCTPDAAFFHCVSHQPMPTNIKRIRNRDNNEKKTDFLTVLIDSTDSGV
jgi:hypothetical protein